MSYVDVDNLLYFEYHENGNERFKAEDFIEKYEVEPRYIDDTNVFTFLSGILEQEEVLSLCQWKKSLGKKWNEVSTCTFHIKTKNGRRALIMTMIPLLDSRNQDIEYFVGYFS